MGLIRYLVVTPGLRVAAATIVLSTSLTSVVLYALVSPSADEIFIMDEVNGAAYLGAAALAFLVAHKARKRWARRWFWLGACTLLAALAYSEISSGLIDRIDAAWAATDYDDLVLWVLTLIGLYVACTMESAPKLSILLMKIGFVLQSISNIIDLFEPDLISLTAMTVPYVQFATNVSEFLFIQAYLFGLMILIVASVVETRPLLARAARSDGTAASRIHAVHNTYLITQVIAGNVPRQRQLLGLLRAAPLISLSFAIRPTLRNWRLVRERTGKGPLRQIVEQQLVAARQRIAAPWYYAFELFLDERRAKAGEYLSRFETKGSIYKLLRLPKARRTSDKHLFLATCREAGIRAVPALMLLSDGEVGYTVRGDDRLPTHSLFIKPRDGRGGVGAERWRYDSDGLYRNHVGVACDEPTLRDRLLRQSRQRDLLVQPCLANHSDLQDLANGALATVRMVTCEAEHGNFEVTDAAFRMARGLNAVVDNFHAGGVAAAVDIATGRLGRATDLGFRQETGWLDRHPVTGATITGRILPHWHQAVDLVQQAHVVFRGRAVIGWDVAILGDGPCIIEANSAPDLDIIQRTQAAPVGNARLGQLMAYQLRRYLQ